MNKYTIIATVLYYGQMTKCVHAEAVRSECEHFKKIMSLGNEPSHMQIEVINNETGEAREYWNNHDNKIQF